MGPDKPLPYNDTFPSVDAYIDSLINLVGAHDLLRTLCGRVHILDFYLDYPSFYEQVLPQDWRDFFDSCQVQDVLDLLMFEDLEQFSPEARATLDDDDNDAAEREWRKDVPVPPRSLVDYVDTVRKHSLLRKPDASQCARNRALKPTQKLVRDVAVGMNIKKVHEVGLFARYMDQVTEDVAAESGKPISHLVDFGSGQNYLGRALASEPYNKRIVAIESRSQNAERAREYDVQAGLAKKEKLMRNKKAFRSGEESWETPKPRVPSPDSNLTTPPPEQPTSVSSTAQDIEKEGANTDASLDPNIALSTTAKGSVQYFEHSITDGDLSDIITQLPSRNPSLAVMSLHSCGNLVHHGLRSLILNPAVKVVAMVGCCYNLVTERLTPPSHKLPSLQPPPSNSPHHHPPGDPHGFPMSTRLCTYKPPCPSPTQTPGISLNITARMMAVQAPQNWGPAGTSAFFNRHFYRALLQRLFLDHHIVGPPHPARLGTLSPSGHTSGGTPIIIGHLKKPLYANFVTYARGATGKLAAQDDEMGRLVRHNLTDLTDDDIRGYEVAFAPRKKELSVVWSLMAFSAAVIEAVIVVDRFLWLREQEGVRWVWVEPVFEYAVSPRNLVVVGVKEG
ncbi:hypothetical protein B0A50_03448 [Salinomyces thailandicus]|uniref:Methyltransferase domain-containing protein n=1 Tax=Salinomyces thailandicus TaxID=706561 RepID=A0A4U0U4U0_9PEZI|nr:hypothetical protein B0A50_03448 [Salinomyces thailandica]